MSQELNFEQAMARLEEVVRLLESGEKSLGESLALFEEGTCLAAFCEKELTDAERRIVELSEIPEPADDERYELREEIDFEDE